ncbi:MAG: heat-inducible transcription repressor HrcA [Candidatus Margulisiibacteriota bacterium]|nr:MAG: heat-inducible transcription repressor HrcA [Candidatus Margulisbacteria bacterium GWD2_39_127]OGI02095.1 MAG: heat-inducible transcription repressor HrcA [Candidatus Margulisbacteria bacterium GWF2_38_17]OGI10472.1 MAG: heat-inducible transcription repressor HrcA [Candidatus Margulisbacteria bacterium GWE2_39_32]PZM79982.1 MAG: heat-inducible transcription repressor HrcA [Candidatus Margulisiibacteriota bacterium]HAR62449.1 heat-inducible transcription repressor HrcA [Candidatus Margul
MDKRKNSILQAVINSYIDSGNAISSSKLAQDYGFHVSPATIRSELALLETEGYLTHPHTSSGRVPTDKGYRFYVDNYVKSHLTPNDTRTEVIKTYKDLFNDISLILEQTAYILAELTNCFCFISMPDMRHSIIKMIKVILLNVHQILVVILMDTGISKDFLINGSEKIDDADLDQISNLLHKTFLDKSFAELENLELKKMLGELPGHKKLLEKTFQVIKNAGAYLKERPTIFKKGASNLMIYNHDFSCIEDLRGIVEVIEQEKTLANLIFEKNTTADEVNFTIGSENNENRLRSCTMAQVSYTVNDNEGDVVVIGPRRLKYMNISTVLHAVSKNLDTIINEQITN